MTKKENRELQELTIQGDELKKEISIVNTISVIVSIVEIVVFIWFLKECVNDINGYYNHYYIAAPVMVWVASICIPIAVVCLIVYWKKSKKRKEILRKIEYLKEDIASESDTNSKMPSTNSDAMLENMRNLKKMYDEGLITETEYNDKKNECLKNMN